MSTELAKQQLILSDEGTVKFVSVSISCVHISQRQLPIRSLHYTKFYLPTALSKGILIDSHQIPTLSRFENLLCDRCVWRKFQLAGKNFVMFVCMLCVCKLQLHRHLFFFTDITIITISTQHLHSDSCNCLQTLCQSRCQSRDCPQFSQGLGLFGSLPSEFHPINRTCPVPHKCLAFNKDFVLEHLFDLSKGYVPKSQREELSNTYVSTYVDSRCPPRSQEKRKTKKRLRGGQGREA